MWLAGRLDRSEMANVLSPQICNDWFHERNVSLAHVGSSPAVLDTCPVVVKKYTFLSTQYNEYISMYLRLDYYHSLEKPETEGYVCVVCACRRGRAGSMRERERDRERRRENERMCIYRSIAISRKGAREREIREIQAARQIFDEMPHRYIYI